MSFTSKLADLFVQFTVQGIDAFSKGLDQVQASLGKIAEGAQRAGNLITSAFAKALIGVGGFVTAGIAASAVGQQFAFVMERLARSIAGLFGPEIRKVLELLQRFSNWLDSLSNSQRAMIAHMIEGAAAMLIVGKVLPFVFAGIQMVVAGLGELAAAFGVLDVETGGILPLIGAVVTGLVALGVGAGVAGGAFDGLFAKIDPLLKSLQDIGGRILKAIQPALDMAANLFDAIVAGVGGALPAIGEMAVQFTEALVPALQALAELGYQVFVVGMAVWNSSAISFADVLKYVVVPQLQIVTAYLKFWAEMLGLITGKKLDTEHKPAKGDRSACRGVEERWRTHRKGQAGRGQRAPGTHCRKHQRHERWSRQDQACACVRNHAEQILQIHDPESVEHRPRLRQDPGHPPGCEADRLPNARQARTGRHRV